MVPLIELVSDHNSSRMVFSGTISVVRYNDQGGQNSIMDLNVNDPYYASYTPYFNYRILKYNTDNSLKVLPCRFKYNNIWYGGIKISNSAGVYITINGRYTDQSYKRVINIGLKRYRLNNTGAIEIQEIYDSISTDDVIISNFELLVNGQNYSNSLHYIPFSGNVYKNIIVSRKTEQSNIYFIYYTLTWDVGPVNSASCAYVIYSGSSTSQTDFYYYKLYGRMPDEDIIIEKIKLDGEQSYKIHIKYSGGYPGTYGVHILPLLNSNDYLITSTDI